MEGKAMHRVILFCILLMPGTPAMASIVDSRAFINEFHYDNVGGDRMEFIELLCPTNWPEKELLSLTLYNGSSGRTYGGPFAYDRFTLGEEVNGYQVLTLNVAMQNGAPDGFALARGTAVLQFLSYEGAFLASNGVAAGLTSTDVEVLEESSTPLGVSLQLAGQGDSYLDFAWQAPVPHSRGLVNDQQSIGNVNAVPEPMSAYVWSGLGLLAVIMWYMSRSRRAAVGTVSAAPG